MTASTDNGLIYPLGTRPGEGETLEVADGIFWVRMAIPIPGLDFINLWLVEDGDGWTVIDTGLRGRRIQDNWRTILDLKMGGRPVKRVICTHFHPDHLGQAGWFVRDRGATLWMSMLEWTFGRMLALDELPEPPPDFVAFYRRHGLSEDGIAAMKARGFGNFSRAVEELPRSFRRLRDGDTIRIGADDWRVVVGTGHSPEHVCLLCDARGLLFSGDQVLPRISPHIGVYPSEPDGNPLRDYMNTLRRFEVLDEDLLVLPAHGDPFRGLPLRLRQLLSHHDKRLDQLEAALSEPMQAIDTLPILFRREIKDEHVTLALGEAIAHLHHLVHDGRIERLTDTGDGITFRRSRR